VVPKIPGREDIADIHIDVVLTNQGEELENQSWQGFSIKQYIRRNERAVIERVLRDAGGSVASAARPHRVQTSSKSHLVA